VDVVVPVLNEVEMLPVFLDRLGALGLPLNPIFVDNGSADGTVELLRGRPGITLIEHGRNLGYGRSLADGLRASRAERVVVIDADCEYPRSYSRLACPTGARPGGVCQPFLIR